MASETSSVISTVETPSMIISQNEEPLSENPPQDAKARRAVLLEKFADGLYDSFSKLAAADQAKIEELEKANKILRDEEAAFVQKTKDDISVIIAKLKEAQKDLADLTQIEENRKKILEKYPGDPVSSLVKLEEEREKLVNSNHVLAKRLKREEAGYALLSRHLKDKEAHIASLGNSLREKEAVICSQQTRNNYFQRRIVYSTTDDDDDISYLQRKMLKLVNRSSYY